MANPFDFSAGAVLTAAQLNQIADFETFTPSWTNITVGNATNSGVYAQVNELGFWQVEPATAKDVVDNYLKYREKKMNTLKSWELVELL